ncbi:MAG: VWA domain-containing protein [Anderseniella sp.]
MPAKLIKSMTLTATATLVLFISAPASADTQKNVMFVLDASNSMWGQIDGKPKIEIAKTVLKDLTTKMPAGAKMGLIAYGHRFDRKLNECDDMELMNPIGHFSTKEADNAFSFITPKGQTPIANTLRESAGWLQEQKGQDNTVVLISDGLESCDGDPCAAAKALNDAGVTTKIHVVGFDLSTEQRAKLECISKNGNGKMFAANDAASLSDAMNEVRADVAKPVVVAQAPKVEEPPKYETVFEDQFDGDNLAEGWAVASPNPDRYIAEAGELLMIAGAPAGNPSMEDMTNVISHAGALPKGDWEIEAKFRIEAQQGTEAFYVGTRNDHENWIAAALWPKLEGGRVSMMTSLVKNESGKRAGFDTIIESSKDTGYQATTERWKAHGLGEKYAKRDFILILKKTGRSYSMSGTYSSENEPDYRTFKTENLKMLRAKKNLFFAFGLNDQNKGLQGEGNVLIDYVRVRGLAAD